MIRELRFPTPEGAPRQLEIVVTPPFQDAAACCPYSRLHVGQVVMKTHVPVGYYGQYRRSCHSECMTVTATTSCRTLTTQFSRRAGWSDFIPWNSVMPARSSKV